MSIRSNWSSENKLSLILDDVRSWTEGENFKGYDPYDALNSPILSVASLGLKWPRIAFTQLMKRSPINMRPLFLISKDYNPKGLGLFLWSYTKLYKATKDETAKKRAYEVYQLLNNCITQTANGFGWGYNFDWQSRAFFIPKGTPTIVNSSFIGHALLEAFEVFEDEQFYNTALSVGRFICGDLHRTKEKDETFCFSYTPIDKTIVHNANLLGASLLMRLFQNNTSSNFKDLALASLTYSMNRQQADGSWWYADTNYQNWVDSFHTGFNLQCIRYFLQLGEGKDFNAAYGKGVDYYAKNFFEQDGTAKYYNNRLLPEDIHSYAQAIVFFSREGKEYESLVDVIVNKMMASFFDPSGYFYFQRRKGEPIKIPYIRWAQSWAFHALSEYYTYRVKGSN